MSIASVPSASSQPLSLNSTSVSSGTFTQALSSSVFSTFITSGEASPVPSSGSSSGSLGPTAVPVNRTQAITSAASTSFPASSSGQSISSSFSVISESSAVPSSVSLSSSAATRSSVVPIRPGDPIDTPSTSAAPVQRSPSSSETLTSLVSPSSAKSVSASSSPSVSTNTLKAVAVKSSEAITSTSAMSTPTASSTVPVTDKTPSSPKTDPAPAPGSTSEVTDGTSVASSAAPSQPASSPAAKSSSVPLSPTAASSKPASLPSSPVPQSNPASQAPSRPTNVESPSVTPSAAPASQGGGQSPSVVNSQTVARAQQQSAVSPKAPAPSSEASRAPAVETTIAPVGAIQKSSSETTNPPQADAPGPSAASNGGSPVPALTSVVQTSAPPAQEQSVAQSAATGSPNAPSESGSADLSSFRGQANAQTATATSTITDKPETTLSSPVFVTTTDSKGHTTISEPPLFASVGLTTLPDGQLVSTTHIIANPTGIWGVDDQSGAGRGFFANTGAVAGVFLVVGIVFAVFVAGLCYFFQKKRRRQRIRHSISRPLPYPDNPFEDPRDTPSSTQTQMRYVSDTEHRSLVGTGLGLSGASQAQQPRHILDDEISEDGIQHPVTPNNLQYNAPQVPQPAHGMGLAGVGSGHRSVGNADYNGPFSDYYNSRPTHKQKPSLVSQSDMGIGLAITTEQTHHAEDPHPIFPQASVSVSGSPSTARPSSTESSPSIYPASLPPVATEEVDNGHHGHVNDMEPAGLSPPPPPPERRRPPPVLTLQNSDSSSTPSTVPSVSIPPSVSSGLGVQAPLLPPRNPLRTSQHEASKILSRTHPGSEKERDRFSQLGFKSYGYEPLTPPDSSHGSAVLHDDHTYGGSQRSVSSERRNPFADVHSSDAEEGSNMKNHLIPSPVRDTFYTRRKNVEVRPSSSVEWKQ